VRYLIEGVLHPEKQRALITPGHREICYLRRRTKLSRSPASQKRSQTCALRSVNIQPALTRPKDVRPPRDCSPGVKTITAVSATASSLVSCKAAVRGDVTNDCQVFLFMRLVLTVCCCLGLGLPFAYALMSAQPAHAETLWVTAFGECRVLGYQSPFSNIMAASVVIGAKNMNTGCVAPTGAHTLNLPNISAFVDNYLAVADSENSRVIFFAEPLTIGEPASLVYGQPDFFSNGFGHRPKQLNHAGAVAYDSVHQILAIADSSNGRVLLYENNLTLNPHPNIVLGEKKLTQGSSNGIFPSCWGPNPTSFYNLAVTSATPTTLCNPAALKFDSLGNLWVAEQGNSRVVRFSPPFHNGMAADLALGQPDLNSDTPRTTPDGLAGVNDLAFDSAGNLWVADWLNGRALKYQAPFSIGMAASVVKGQPDMFTRDGNVPYGDQPNCHNANESHICDASGIAVDSAGNVFVSDFDTDRLLIFSDETASSTPASVILGVAGPTTAYSIHKPVGLTIQE